MNKAQQMLAKAGFPDTAAGRAAFHKQYPTPESFFQVHGGQDTEMYGAGSTIHIDPSKRGTFTAAATKHDKSVQEFASQVLANKENYSPAMVKKANFARNAASWKHEDGGTVDALQLMSMPTPRMYGGGSKVHPTLTLSTEQNPNPSFKPSYSSNSFYDNPYSINSRTTLSGAYPLINNKLNLTGSYDAGNNNYTGGLEVNIGDILSGGGKGPSRKYDNPDIAHKGRSFLDTYGHLRAGVTNNKDGKVLPFVGGDFTVAHQMGRVKGPNGLRQPKGTIYATADLNNVESQTTAHDINQDNNYIRANLGGSYNFGKGLGIYGEAGYDFMRDAPRGEIGLKKTFAQGGHVTDYSPSSNFGAVLSKNNSYMHGYANGGRVGMYGFGSTIKDLGYGLVDTQLGTIGGLTGIQSMQDIIDEDQYSNDKFDDVTNFAGKTLSTAANFIPGAQPFLMATRGIGELANTIGKIDENNYDPSKHTSDWDKAGNAISQIGSIASSFTNPMGAADTLSKGAKTAMNVGKIAGLGATAFKAGQDIDKSQGGTYDPTNLLNLGMGVAKSGFFGGNTNTSNNFTNTKGAIDYTPTMDTPLYAAMGGAVNAPNMMKYAQGGGVNMTEINVEHGELLTDENGNILTEYGSNALPPHPADGSMDDRGTVPAPEGAFVVTAALAEKYKLADKLQRDAMRNNITFDKQRKEAKQAKQAEQEQMMQQQNMMMQQQMMPEIMMGKHGGMVRGYGYGGGVKMYGLGGEDGIPYAQFNPYTSLQTNPYAEDYSEPQFNKGNYLNSMLTPGSDLNLQVEPFGFPKQPTYIKQSGYNWNPVQPDNPMYESMTRKSAQMLPTSSIDNLDVIRTNKPYPSNNSNTPLLLPGDYYDYQKGANDPTQYWADEGTYYPNQDKNNPQTWDQTSGDGIPTVTMNDLNKLEQGQGYPNDKMDIYDYMRFAPAAWNAIQALKKPSKVPSNLGNVDTKVEMPRLSSYSAEQAIDDMDAKNKYLARQAGVGSNYLAFLTAMNNQQSMNKAKVIEGYRNAQAGLDAEGVKLRKSLEAQNAQAETQRYMLQSQADAVPTEYASKAMANLGDIANTNYTYKKALPMFEMMYPEYAAKLKANRMRNRGKTKTD